MRSVKIPYTPHEGQRQFHDDPARFRILTCGRRWGKDRSSILETHKQASLMAEEPRPKSLIPRVHVWSVAPTFPMLRQTWAELKAFMVPTGLIKRKDEAELTLEFWNGVYWELKSAAKPEDLVGTGLDVLHMTEAARVREVAYTENIRPTLSSPLRGPKMRGQGLAIFNSTPKGRHNWYYKLHMRGQQYLPDGTPNPTYDPQYRSWQFPTASNPYINPEEVLAAQRELPANVYEQEYLASFLAESAGVFVNVEAQGQGDFQPAERGQEYAVGVDLAYLQDYTVITVLHVPTRHVVHWERFQSPLWEEQAPRILWAAREYNNAPILIDRTGVGQTAPEMLRKELGWGHRVEGYFFTQDSKEALVSQLQMAFQTKTITYPAELDVLRDELTAYEYTYTKGGRFRYSAPAGEHDDAVMSLALALEATKLGPYEVIDQAY